ncbi:CAP domain-containing protein [Streptomyces paromomycinus]|uniref:CAP domain-containing protein n=1 Tax=Streptomyces paromomycinus TaxID=92743 RepID=UPI000F6163FF|nr:CAP domain-containing protein [Streptomyces paromomycinus]
MVAVLVLAGLTVGGSAVATPPDGGPRPGLPDAAYAALSSHGMLEPQGALEHQGVPEPQGVLEPQVALESHGALLSHWALLAHPARPPYAAPAAQTLRAPGSAHVPRNASVTRTAVIQLVNRERAKAGCRSVRAHRTVTKAAQRHSDHMAREDSLSHRERGGSGPGSRLSAVGYDWRRAGENIARGQRDAAEVVRAWAHSPEHRVVLADCAFRHAGVGINSGTDDRGPWWTLLLARPA